LHAIIPLAEASQCALVVLSHLVLGAVSVQSPLQLPPHVAAVIISVSQLPWHMPSHAPAQSVPLLSAYAEHAPEHDP
jgi:hypothetical protein